jgi:hypothetical protein
MQKLLKSPWHSKCAGRLADELFRGPLGHEPEGIGSGHPEHGRLPEILFNLLEQEHIGGERSARELLVRTSKPLRQADEEGRDIQRRWSLKNSRHIRSAGQVE